MAYIQVEASVRTHKKFLKAGPAASWLWLCGIGYCQDGLTDGFIPFEALGFLGIKASTAKNLKCALVAHGLWNEVPGGWQVHDYLEHNKSAAVIEGIKQGRRKSGSVGGVASGESRRDTKQPSKQVLQPNVEGSAEAAVEPVSALLCSTRLDSSRLDEGSAETRDVSPPLFDFPTDGKPPSWTLTEAMVTSWRELYPALDVLAECRKAKAWIDASPARRKTASGMSRFLVNWLNKSTNTPRSMAPNLPQKPGRWDGWQPRTAAK